MSRVLDLVLAGTPAQFDDGPALATTEFVRKALGGFSGSIPYTVNGPIPAANAGLRGVWNGVAAGALTLPPIGDVPIGATFYVAAGDEAVTISPDGADEIFSTDNTSLASVSLLQGDDVQITRGGLGWAITGGASALRNSGTLGGEAGTEGWQRLPSGLIIQWGLVNVTVANTNQAFTLPIPFPNAFYGAMGTHYTGVSAPAATPAIAAGRSGLGTLALRSSAIAAVFYTALGS